MRISKNLLDYWTDKQLSRRCWQSTTSILQYDKWNMKYRDKSRKLWCYSMMFLPWRSCDDYEHISRRIITNRLDRSLPNPYPFLHLFRLHLQFLFQALQKIPSTLMWGPENPLSRSRMILNQLLGTAVMLPLFRHPPDPHFSFLALFPPYHPILTMDYLMVPPFPHPLITVWSLCLTSASCTTIFSSSYLLYLLLILSCVHY